MYSFIQVSHPPCELLDLGLFGFAGAGKPVPAFFILCSDWYMNSQTRWGLWLIFGSFLLWLATMEAATDVVLWVARHPEVFLGISGLIGAILLVIGLIRPKDSGVR